LKGAQKLYVNLKTILCLLLIFNILVISFPGLIISICNLSSPRKIKVYNHQTHQTIKLNLDEYLKGVLAAEMPSNFPMAALKAQAVAARTYTLKKLQSKEQITTDSTKDQAWIAKQELLANWGLKKYLSHWFKISAAVESTSGIILSYNDKLISAVYHSTSGGTTASAEEIWGQKIPYLSPVSSNYETTSPYYKKQYHFSYSQLREQLNTSNLDENNLQITNRSPTGRVLQLQASSSLFSGREIRQKLNIPSTLFKLTKNKTGVKIITSGYGHGVGLSQYGAQGLAQQGYNFTQILHHYYQGANCKKIN